MDNAPRRYQLAALFLTISGIAHISVAALSGFRTLDVVLFTAGVTCLLLAYLLQPGRRWTAYCAFLFMLVGTPGAYMFMPQDKGLIQIVYQTIIAANILCALVLFILLWRSKNPVKPESSRKTTHQK